MKKQQNPTRSRSKMTPNKRNFTIACTLGIVLAILIALFYPSDQSEAAHSIKVDGDITRIKVDPEKLKGGAKIKDENGVEHDTKNLEQVVRVSMDPENYPFDLSGYTPPDPKTGKNIKPLESVDTDQYLYSHVCLKFAGNKKDHGLGSVVSVITTYSKQDKKTTTTLYPEGTLDCVNYFDPRK